MPIYFNKANNQYIEVAYTLPAAAGTIEFEIMPKSLYNNNSLWENSVGADDWEAWITSAGIISARDDSKTVTSPAITIGTNWRHVAYTWDAAANQTKLYLDGSLVDTDIHDPLAAGTYFRLGGKDNNASHFYARNFRLWSICRTATEINDYKSAELNGDETGLEIYWKLDETGGSTVNDSSVNNRDGTAYGSYTWTDGISNALVAQESVEIVLTPDTRQASITQLAVEVVRPPTEQKARIVQIALEVILAPVDYRVIIATFI